MGDLISKISRQIPAPTKKKILFIGLDSAGKTSILYRLALAEPPITTVPTCGVNQETFSYSFDNHNISITAWDIGGGDKIRALWKHYYPGLHAIIWVIDSNDRSRIDECKEEIYHVMNHPDLENAVLLVYANKQDLLGVLTPQEVQERLSLEKIHQKWAVFGSCYTTGEGLNDGLDWMIVNS